MLTLSNPGYTQKREPIVRRQPEFSMDEEDEVNKTIIKQNNKCLVCNSHVDNYVYHCESCDLCCEGFSHHCKWLGKCIGERNKILWFGYVLGFGVGLAVSVVGLICMK